MMQEYNLNISPKTKFLNFCRLIFKINFLEKLLLLKSQGKSANSFIGKLLPPNYLYHKNTFRHIETNGIKYKLDISDVVDYHIYFGIREKAKDVLYSLIKNGMTVLDVGANIGETALNFSKTVGEKGIVLAIEPDDISYSKAQHNISLNNINNIQLYKIGLGNENKKDNLYLVDKNNRGKNRILKTGAFLSIEIKLQKLDDFIIENNINKIDFIKIDVEGFELNVLKGAEKYLIQFKPILFIELDDNNLKEQGHSANELIQYLESFNYKISMAESGKIITSNENIINCHFDIVCN